MRRFSNPSLLPADTRILPEIAYSHGEVNLIAEGLLKSKMGLTILRLELLPLSFTFLHKHLDSLLSTAHISQQTAFTFEFQPHINLKEA